MLYIHFVQIFLSLITSSVLNITQAKLFAFATNKEVPSQCMKRLISTIVGAHSDDNVGVILNHTDNVELEILIDYTTQEISKASIPAMYFMDVGDIKLEGNYLIMIFTNSLEYTWTLTEDLMANERIESRTTIVLIVNELPHIEASENLLEHFWNFNFLDVVIASERENMANIITLNPFNAKNDRLVTLKTYSKDALTSKIRNLNSFTIKALYTTTESSKVRIVETENDTKLYVGRDVTTLETICDNVNARLEIVNVNDYIQYSFRNPWFTSFEISDRLEEQRRILNESGASILIKTQYTSENNGVIENVYPHIQNNIVLLVPKARKITKYERVWEEFIANPLWFFYIGLMVAVIGLRTGIRKLLRYPIDQQYMKHLVRATMTCSSPNFPYMGIHAVSFYGWLVWASIISIILQAKTTSFLSTDKYEPEINSFEDLKSINDIPVYGLTSFIEDIQKKYNDTQYADLVNTFNGVVMDETIAEYLMLHNPSNLFGRLGLIVVFDSAKLFTRTRNLRIEGRAVFHLVQESLVLNYNSFHVTNRSPFLPHINKKTRQLTEGGFMELWENQDLLKSILDGNLYPDENFVETTPETKPLGFETMQYFFYLTLFGYAISSLCFLLELIIYRVKNRN